MTVINDKLLTDISREARCSWCGRAPFGLADPAHVFSRGTGRLDIACNVVPLDRGCHRASHDGHSPMQIDLLAIAAARCDTLQDYIRDVVYALRRLPGRARYDRKARLWQWSLRPTSMEIEYVTAGLSCGARQLAGRVFGEIGV